MQRKLAIASLVLSAVASPVTTPAASAEEWSYALEAPAGSIQHSFAVQFKRHVEEQTDGDVSVSVYPGGSIVTPSETDDAVSAGVIQLGSASPGNLGARLPTTLVFSIPYLLSANPEVNRRIFADNRLVQDQMQQDFREINLRLLAIYPEWDLVWLSKSAINHPSDFVGLKFRTPTLRFGADFLEILGAHPVVLPHAEVYGALQRGVIDGAETAVSAVEVGKLYEVGEYITWPGIQSVTMVVANEGWYDALSEEYQNIVSEAFRETTRLIFESLVQSNQDSLRTLMEMGSVVVLNEEQRVPFEEQASKLRRHYIELTGSRGEEVLAAVEAAVSSAEASLEAEGSVAGVDDDGDGLRDDVGQFIQTTYTAQTAEAAVQYARAVQQAVVNADSPRDAVESADRRKRAIECLFAIRPEDAFQIRAELEDRILNTIDRWLAYVHANDHLTGQTFSFSANFEQSCER